MRIDHNRVLISRGESAVYAREINMGDKYATPYMLLSSFLNPKIVLKVKANKNDKEAVLTYEAAVGDALPRFTSRNVVDLDPTKIDPLVDVEETGVLYRLYQNNKYIYYYLPTDEGEPTIYKCVFRFDIQSDDTKSLRPATYYYDISLLAKTGDNIDYKEVWLEPTEFIIGGSY